MARPKAFDPQIALSKAMAVFWEQGYAATSIQDLVAAMGISRASLYDTYQDKRQLFLQAIAHYQGTIVQDAIAHLQERSASRPAIENHFWQVANRATIGSPRSGCLMTNTLVELAAQDSEVAAVLGQGLRQVEDAFFQALVRAQDRGEIGPDRNLRALAHYLTTSLQGLRVMSRVPVAAESLQPTIQLILQVLD